MRDLEIDPQSGRTVRRIERLRTVLKRRQPDLHVVLENVHDPHNVAAVLRSCDAVGVQTIHLIYNEEKFPELGKRAAAGTLKWVERRWYDSIGQCYEALREEGVSILATDLSARSRPLYESDLVGPIALVFGNEHRGVSEKASELADGNFQIPMMGFAQSLNISVACAVSLYEALRQRLSAGCYSSPRLSDGEIERLIEEWSDR